MGGRTVPIFEEHCSRMIPLKRVDHISMGHADWEEQSTRLQQLLGFKLLHSFGAAGKSDFAGSVSQVRGTGIEFEILSPGGPKSFVRKFLEEGGPRLHHIAVEVHDIDAAAEELQRLGITPFGGVTDDGQWRLTYIHPKDSGGILWQLFTPYKFYEGEDRNAGGGVAGLKRIEHVSMACVDLDNQIAFQERVFGMEQIRRWTDEPEGYHGAIMAIPGSLLQFEMIQPSRPGSFAQKFIDTRRPGMHHICCEVESVDKTAEGLRSVGIEPYGGVIESDWHRHTFLHPRDSGGVLFQLFEE